MILLSRAEEIILLAVFKLKDNAYGVTIRDQIHKDIGNYWSFGVIYKTLKKLNYKKYVQKIASEPLSERGGRSRYYYRITPEGIAALEKIYSVQSSLWKGVVKLTFEEKTE
ncbi:MAG: PadR family transcriptional regulator [Candidatus Aminicenantes bacterium]|jgi:DNA-binding PadR family transcriptional regulator